MDTVDPLDRLNKLVLFTAKGMPYRSKSRLYIITRLAGRSEKLKSSKELLTHEGAAILDYWYPDWRNPDAAPPENRVLELQSISEAITRQLIAVFGNYDEYLANIEAEDNQRRAEKAARKAERRAIYEARQAARKELKRQRWEAKRAVNS